MGKVLLVGMGDVGRHILEFLARDPNCPELVVGDINAETGQKKLNTALSQAAVCRLYPTIRFRKIDLTKVEETAQLIQEEAPDVVINGTVMQTWHVIRQLPKEIYAELSAASLGAFLPCQVGLAYKLMKAIEISGLKPHVINTALSCIVNPVLAKAGYAPTIGIGNVELIEPGVRVLISRKRNVPMDAIKVFLVCHHAWWVYPREAGYKKPPFFMKVLVNDVDVTEQLDTEQLMWESGKLHLPGAEFTTISASSAIKNMHALMNPSGFFTHSPAPLGLPGGYPVTLSNKGAEITLPQGITLKEAISINEQSQQIDGIAKIEDGGKVTYADYTHDILSSKLGFDHKTFTAEESFDVALELIQKYRDFAARYNVFYA